MSAVFDLHSESTVSVEETCMPEGGSLDLAIVHDYLIQMGGAERVVALMAKHFPDAKLYTSYRDSSGLLPEFDNREIITSWLQRVRLNGRHFKKLFPLYPFAFRMLPRPKASAVWVSASTFAKCIPTEPSAKTFCYCHAPTRFLWQTDAYLDTEISNPVLRRIIRAILPPLRRIDYDSAQKMDYLVANSQYIRGQIKKHYDRESDVIYPPVDVDRFDVSTEDDGYYLVVSRLIGYKRIDRAIKAFANLDRPLHIIGDGTDRQRLEQIAPSNVKFFGRVSDDEVRRQFARCRAFIFPGFEDFGITPVEAMACGKPVLAYGKGGALETVVPGRTGFHFKDEDELRALIHKLESVEWDAYEIRRHVEQFSSARFIREMVSYMEARV